MTKYMIKRIAYSVVTLFILITVTFFMMQLLPGEPFSGEKKLPDAVLKNMYAKYGLDKPVWEQFFIYIGNCLRGDLGLSLTYNRPITTMIFDSFATSFDLGIRAMILAVCMGLLLGTIAAVKRNTPVDTICMLIALLGVSVPSFIVGSVLQYFLAYKLGVSLGVSLFAVTGWGSINSQILPVFALSFGTVATVSRLMRTSMLDVLGQDYIKTAKAKGLSQKTIILKHAVRNAISPVITILGPTLASVLTGSFVIENLFSIPGLGRYFVISISGRDYPMISGTTIFYGAFLILANLLVDVMYGLVDPRVKIEEGKA